MSTSEAILGWVQLAIFLKEGAQPLVDDTFYSSMIAIAELHAKLVSYCSNAELASQVHLYMNGLFDNNH